VFSIHLSTTPCKQTCPRDQVFILFTTFLMFTEPSPILWSNLWQLECACKSYSVVTAPGNFWSIKGWYHNLTNRLLWQCISPSQSWPQGRLKRVAAHSAKIWVLMKINKIIFFKNLTLKLQYFPAHKTHHDFFVRNFRKKKRWMYFNFNNLLKENRIVTYQN